MSTLTISFCRSGTEEEYSKQNQLLQDISSCMRDLNAIRVTQAQERAAQVKKSEDDKHKREEMRQAAMEVLSSKFTDFYNHSLHCYYFNLIFLFQSLIEKKKMSSRGIIFCLFIPVSICGYRCQYRRRLETDRGFAVRHLIQISIHRCR